MKKGNRRFCKLNNMFRMKESILDSEKKNLYGRLCKLNHTNLGFPMTYILNTFGICRLSVVSRSLDSHIVNTLEF